MTSKFDMNQAGEGGVFTAKGNKIPPKPKVSEQVMMWSKLINRLREMNYTPDKVMTVIKADQEIIAEEIANGKVAEDT